MTDEELINKYSGVPHAFHSPRKNSYHGDAPEPGDDMYMGKGKFVDVEDFELELIIEHIINDETGMILSQMKDLILLARLSMGSEIEDTMSKFQETKEKVVNQYEFDLKRYQEKKKRYDSCDKDELIDDLIKIANGLRNIKKEKKFSNLQISFVRTIFGEKCLHPPNGALDWHKGSFYYQISNYDIDNLVGVINNCTKQELLLIVDVVNDGLYQGVIWYNKKGKEIKDSFLTRIFG